MIIISHPTGNEFSRAVTQGLEDEGMLGCFITTLAFKDEGWIRLLPDSLRTELLRRQYSILRSKVITYPWRELARLLALRLNLKDATRHETGWASLDAVYRTLDVAVSRYLEKSCTDGAAQIRGIYCYEDGALRSFQTAKSLGIKCFYDLPIAYWETSQRLLLEEAQRLPDWEPTLGATRDSPSKLARKTEEISLADMVFCPSQFVLDSLPETIRGQKPCIVSEYGSPQISVQQSESSGAKDTRLRLLFAGAMTQRKGLADVFAAMKLLNRKNIELVVMGANVLPMDFYRSQFADFTYEPPRPHADVLRLMSSCHALILPSIIEGRALVQQEAMACGLPIIMTANAGGQDLIDEGKTGFLVPIRSPEILAERIAWLADHISSIGEMGNCARQRAAAITWENYKQKIVSAIKSMLQESVPA